MNQIKCVRSNEIGRLVAEGFSYGGRNEPDSTFQVMHRHQVDRVLNDGSKKAFAFSYRHLELFLLGDIEGDTADPLEFAARGENSLPSILHPHFVAGLVAHAVFDVERFLRAECFCEGLLGRGPVFGKDQVHPGLLAIPRQLG